ncbi:MAG TPA: hypothetical protein VF829_02535 [Candidatus Paceibacterota bacterium]
MEKHTCSFCNAVGKNGAEWLLLVPGRKDCRVHKPCGGKAIALAPEGVKVTMVPSPELKARWRAERDARDAQAFWAEKFAQAKPIR